MGDPSYNKNVPRRFSLPASANSFMSAVTPTPAASRNGFARQLARYGPRQLTAPISVAEARSYCRHLALAHYENFNVGSLLLPRPLLRHFHHVYAYCRWADDLADETGGGTQTLSLLAWWKDELLSCYAGRPRHPVMIALRDTIEEFAIPPTPFLDLLKAFERDQRVRNYATYEELLGYCRYSANPVGHLVLYLCRSYDTERAKLADDICTGLQLANFWQDVSRDLDIGRIYLPAEDRQRYAYSDEDLHARRCTPAFRELMRFEVNRTRELFQHGRGLIECMPSEFQVDIELFAAGGLAILDAIERLNYDVWRRRPTVGKLTQLRLLGKAVYRRLHRPPRAEVGT
jgi:squalene synthase HpnC